LYFFTTTVININSAIKKKKNSDLYDFSILKSEKIKFLENSFKFLKE